MDFVLFAKAHGLIIDRLADDSRWHRVKTTDKPHHRNGSYKFCGDFGLVQNWATQTEPDLWRPDGDGPANIDHEAIARRAREAAEQIRREQEAAAKRAAWILHQCTTEAHPYLEAKGFPTARGSVWRDEKKGDAKLCLPMRVDGRLVGLQTISDAPGHEKKFIYGQRTNGAVYCVDNKGSTTLLVEGYGTGLSVAAAMHALKTRFRLIVCFSAGNLAKIAANFADAIVIADNDKQSPLAPELGGMGLKVAKASGLRYWLSDRCPEDFNDYHQRVGLFKASQSLRAVLFQRQNMT